MNKKTELKWFSICQWEEEEDYLREMNRKGWSLTGIVFPGFYHFQECEPKDVVYRLDYNEDSQKEEAEYVQLFKDFGWEYVMGFAGYSYFRKEADKEGKPEEDEIFCDAESKLCMCKRVIKGKLIPLLILFSLVIIPQLTLNYANLQDGNIATRIFFSVYSVLFSLYIVIFLVSTYQFLKLRKRFKQ